GNIRVTAEPRTNSVLVVATAKQVKLAESVVKAIDVPLDEEAARQYANQGRDNEPYLKSYRIYKADSRSVTKTLSTLMPEVVINESPRDDTIHIMATPADHEAVQKLIREMDPDGSGNDSLDVVPVNNLD